ncbi:hypothetical protein IVA88_28880 [Bradyrhizobium sp. 149]|uniref:hypothetical protein n=1 Tax=Bradyrhizobium sp. 149 TaxID=2782624 RepID=UPI001FFB8163|nr:hypothetical protein [Bradyrhizobium sp. 149]MCK1655415.1 hypothetical protein [Bradyrhizobium sp. 149]
MARQTRFEIVRICRLTRRAKHRQNGIIEISLVQPAPSNWPRVFVSTILSLTDALVAALALPGILADVDQTPLEQPDIPNNEDWYAMWRRRTGQP